MAFSLRLQSIPRAAEQVFDLETLPWLERADPPVAVKAGVREVASNGYRDRFVALTKEELTQWHNAGKPHAYEDIYDMDEWRVIIDRQIALLEGFLARRDCPQFFLACWFEWESGLS